MKKSQFIWCAAIVLSAVGQAQAVDKSWNLGFGGWNSGANWIAPGVPAAADNVFIGNTGPAVNAFVTLNVNSTVASMTITDGMVLNTETSRMFVTGDTTISGRNEINNVVWPSRIQVRNGPNFTYDYVTDNLTLSDEAGIDMIGGGLEVNGLLLVNSNTSIWGEGGIRLTSDAEIAMRLDGTLDPGVEGLTINQVGAGRIDLDGTVAQDSIINITSAMGDHTAFASLTINGDQLSDTFDDTFWVGEENALTMNFSNGWSMGFDSSFIFSNRGTFDPAQINGTELSFFGSMEFLGNGAHAQFNCPVELQFSAGPVVGNLDLLSFANNTVIHGGSYTSESGGRIHFDGDTLVHGGTIITDYAAVTPAPVMFNGVTTWDGIFTVFGYAAQQGDAFVTGPTTIHAYSFDMDGYMTDVVWHIWDDFTVNATRINTFDSYIRATITVEGSAAARATINHASPQAYWIAYETVNLIGIDQSPIAIERLAGSPCQFWESLHVTHLVKSSAPVTFENCLVNFTTPQSQFLVTADVFVDSESTFTGQGSLRGFANKEMLLEKNANLGQTWLINDGDLTIGIEGEEVGQARVSRFSQSATGNWNVQVGGNAPGTLHDHLFVTGAGAALNGQVDVDLVDAGNGAFLPIIGQTFEIINARGGVTGVFSNSPISITPNGTLVEWSFVYTATEVLLRCESITVRCAADFNQDGIVDFFDYLDFVAAFAAESITSDFNHDGIIDFFDYLDFVAAFSAGC